jgi:putative selenium metabolism protein SsnA
MLITNATLITWGDDCQILSNHALYIEGGRIAAIGPDSDLRTQYPNTPITDARGQLVMPGNICTHTHFYGAYARGMAIPGPAPANFPQILERLWWPLDLALDADSIRASAAVFAIDAIRHGTTTLFDHHASPNHINGSLDIIADVVDEAGLRAVLCYEVTDRNGKEDAQAGIQENLRFIEAAKSRPNIAGTFGLHASLSLDDDTLRACADALPDGVGVHIHVAEHEADEEDSLKRSGKRVVHRLNDYDLLGENTIAAHCVHIDDAERALLAETDTWVSHQARSNMNNGVGAMDLDKMLDAGVKICLGTDGFLHNMVEEWKTAYLLHKVANRDPREANGADIANIAVDNNARLTERFFPGQRFGEIAVGAAADLIFVDYHPFTPMSGGNMPWHVLFGFEASMVTATIAAGEVLMYERELKTLDEDKIIADALSYAPDVWQRYQTNAHRTLE